MAPVTCDALIIGAGPAGSVAAAVIAKAGHSARIVDRHAFPRDKVCGDGLAVDSMLFLKKLGLWEKVRTLGYPCSRIEMVGPQGDAFFIDSPVMALRRRVLDEILLNHAVERGAIFTNAEFDGRMEQQDGECRVWLKNKNGEEQIVTSRVVLLAVGCNSFGAIRRAGFETFRKPDLAALRGYYAADWTLDYPLVVFDPVIRFGYFWIFPEGGGVFNIGCGMEVGSPKTGNLHRILDDFLRSNEFLKQRGISPNGRWIEKPRGAMIRTNLVNLDVCRKGNVLLLGEALGSTYPFTGEGIAKAMETGWIAGEVVRDALGSGDMGRLDRYDERIRDEILPLYTPYRVSNFLLRLGINRFLRFVSRSARARRGIAKLMNGTIHPRDVFTARGMFSILLRTFRKR